MKSTKKDIKLFPLLKTLSNQELKSFLSFLQSPFFGKISKRQIALATAFLKEKDRLLEHEDWNQVIHKRLNKISKEIIGATNYSTLKSRLLQKLKAFIAHAQLQQQPKEQDRLLLQKLEKRHFESFQTLTQNTILNIEKNQPYLSKEDYYTLHQLYQNLWFHPESNQYNTDISVFTKSLSCLDNAYFQEKLFYACEIQNRSYRIPEVVKNTHIFSIQAGLNLAKLKQEHVILYCYNTILELLKKGSRKEFDQLKAYFFSLAEKVEDAIYTDLLLFLINYGQIQNKYGDNSYVKDGFEIYKKLIALNLLPVNVFMPEIEFVSILQLAYRQNEATWAKAFFEKYSNYLAPAVTEDLTHFVQLLQQFYAKNYEAVQINFSINNTKEPTIYKLRIRCMLIQAIYEEWNGAKKQYVFLDSLLKAFKVWLKRNKSKFDQDTFNTYYNFIQLVKKLAPQKLNKFSQKSIDLTLKIKIANMPRVVHKMWLLQKFQELIDHTPNDEGA